MVEENKNHILFISDLHLKARDKKIQKIFFNFLETIVPKAQALYILGDLFVFWAGDDDRSPFHERVKLALKKARDRGVPIYCMPGNRDFLLSEVFAEESGCVILNDPVVIDLYGRPTLLTHGDSLCSSDTLHKRTSAVMKSKRFLKGFLKLPLVIRKIATWLAHFLSCFRGMFLCRMKFIDNVRKEAGKVSSENKVDQIIHGHIHKGMIETLSIDGKPLRHIVLNCWERQGSFLIYYSDGQCTLEKCF